MLPEATLDTDGDHNGELARETERKSDLIIGLGKGLQNVADELKAVAKQQEEHDGEDSSYGFGGLFKNLIKSVAKKAAKAGAKQLAKNVKKIVKEKFQERRNRTATYEMEDRIPRLSQLYLSVAEDVENMGKALETLGVEAAVGKEVTV